MSKKKPAPEKENNERWLLTYSDLITLLMIFFVIMYAMSKVDVSKYEQIAQSLGVAMGGGSKVFQVTPGISDTNKEMDSGTNSMKTERNKLAGLKATLDKYLKQNGMSTNVATEISERGLEVSLKDTVLFDSGKADIKVGARGRLIAIGKIINTLPNLIRIEGHTDNVPIHTSQFESNWELSAIRAVKVNQLLISAVNIPPTKVTIEGYGEFHPLVPNTSDSNKAQNRRVNIVILSTSYNPSSAIQ
jgi:chemotaxis protein MotB